MNKAVTGVCWVDWSVSATPTVDAAQAVCKGEGCISAQVLEACGPSLDGPVGSASGESVLADRDSGQCRTSHGKREHTVDCLCLFLKPPSLGHGPHPATANPITSQDTASQPYD